MEYFDECYTATLDSEIDSRIASSRAQPRPPTASAMHDPTEQDLAIADRANAHGASAFAPGTSLREAAGQQLRAYERASAASAPRKTSGRLYQPAPGLTIVIAATGEAFWGLHHVDGVYVADPDICRRAQRNSVDNDHRSALRRNALYDLERARFALTDAGHAALVGRNTSTTSAA
ncbi:MAG TPA: hypothetical protein VGH98_23280 [Gemmatimonadaceae bacterium]|jgi:hypothetical protein